MAETLLTGLSVSDPLRRDGPLPQFQFHHRLFRPQYDSGSGVASDTTAFGGAVLWLTIGTEVDNSDHGSAVMIAPGLALAAKHVIEPSFEPDGSVCKASAALAMTGDGIDIWGIESVSTNDTDVALLNLRRRSELTPRGIECCAISTRIPAPGEIVMIAGFRGKLVSADIPGNNFALNLRAGFGKVGEVYENGRDRVMLPHPCFSVDTSTIGGMSGGPVFDKEGYLVGILTSSLDHPEGPSYVSMLHSAFTLPIESLWLEHGYPCPTTLEELSKTEALYVV